MLSRNFPKARCRYRPIYCVDASIKLQQHRGRRSELHGIAHRTLNDSVRLSVRETQVNVSSADTSNVSYKKWSRRRSYKATVWLLMSPSQRAIARLLTDSGSKENFKRNPRSRSDTKGKPLTEKTAAT